MKPSVTQELRKGRAIGAQRGFADTFNWMLAFCRNLTGGPGVTVDRNDSDHPIIRVRFDESSELRPFAVRSYRLDPESTGEERGKFGWMIYLPKGCVSVIDSCEIINKPMTDYEGHENERNWYRLPLDENSPGVYVTRNYSFEGQSYSEWEFDIVAHAKTSARLKGVDAIDTTSRRFLYVSAAWAGGPARGPDPNDQAVWGDEFAQDVGTVVLTCKNSGGSLSDFVRTYEHHCKNTLSVQGRVRSGFDLVWYFDKDNNGKLSVWKVYCIRNLLHAAGITLEGPEMTEVTGAEESIYAKIKTNPLNPNASEGTVEVVMDPQEITSDDNLTWLKLYSISGNIVSADWRAGALANVQVYR